MPSTTVSLTNCLALSDAGQVLVSSLGGTNAGNASTAGALEDAASRGVEQLSYFQVDNPLARPADPLFVGLHALERAEMSSKVVAKRDAAEKVVAAAQGS